MMATDSGRTIWFDLFLGIRYQIYVAPFREHLENSTDYTTQGTMCYRSENIIINSVSQVLNAY